MSEIEKQSIVKPKKRGGPRPGSGRPKGSTNKITAQEFLDKYKQKFGIDYLEDMLNSFGAANALLVSAGKVGDAMALANALQVKHKYDSLVSKYLWQDIQQLDITSAGEQLKAAFSFVPVELSEWKQNKNDND